MKLEMIDRSAVWGHVRDVDSDRRYKVSNVVTVSYSALIGTRSTTRYRQLKRGSALDKKIRAFYTQNKGE
jgi:hypothetical protein